MLAKVKANIPEWVRIQRVQRDIPTYVTSAGVDKTNLRQYVDEVFLGMTAPLLVTIFSIFWIEKVFKTDKEKLPATMAKSFFIKMVLFALYFIIILGFYTFEPIPFVISFTGFFILFYIIEAIFLQKLFNSILNKPSA